MKMKNGMMIDLVLMREMYKKEVSKVIIGQTGVHIVDSDGKMLIDITTRNVAKAIGSSIYEGLTGLQILTMYLGNEFKIGDLMLACQYDNEGKCHKSVYRFIQNPNGTCEFYDVEHDDSPLDMYDLKECKFTLI